MRWPKRFAELLAISFFCSMIIIVFLFEIFVIRPHLLRQQYRLVWLQVVLACFILMNTCYNLYKVIKTDTTTVGLVLPQNQKLPQWHYCYVCESNAPPRSYHCNVCDRCILRRDHHCVFTGCCIGYKNHKYFMGLLFQVSLACIYATIMNFSYIWSNLRHLSFWWALGAHSIPMGFYLLGVVDLYTACCNVISMLCIIGGLFACALLYYHFWLLCNNQTTYERNQLCYRYDSNNWNQNLHATLGDRWFWTIFLTPLIDSKLPGDGVNFRAKDFEKHL